jgi:transcriptional regulator with XRE-family HTH domain
MWDTDERTLSTCATSSEDNSRTSCGESEAAKLSRNFPAKVGLSDSTLQRIEMMEQNVTIDTIQQIVKRLGCRVSDIFPE